MRRSVRAAALVLLAAALSSCSLFDYSGMVVHKFALVYGVSAYTLNPAGPNLKYPHADASSIFAILQSEGYTAKGRWIDGTGEVWKNGADTTHKIGSPVMSAPDGSTYTGGNPLGDADAPSKANILADIATLSSTIGPDDVLVVYFSGHGTQDTSTSPPREYFDPYASVLDDGTGHFFAYPAPSVRDDELRAAFDALRTPRKVLILDTCNSGGFNGNQYEADWTPPAYKGAWPIVGPQTLVEAISNYASMQSSPTGLSPYGAQVLSAAGRDESSYEDDSFAHGVMTYFLLHGLQGARADVNGDGHVTVLEAFAYAKAGVDANWNADSGVIAASATFEPHISGGPVDFVLF
jgi:hypothetical protein